jgi:hypothetical protein
MLALTTTWSVYNGIRINVDKSGVINNHITSSIPFQINGQPLPLVKTYDYLGLPFNANGIDLKAHVANVTRKTQKLFYASTKGSRGWSPFIRLVLFQNFLRSLYEYAMPLPYGSQVSLSPLIKLQDMLTSWIVNGHKGSDIAHALTGISPVPIRLQELTMRFQSSLLNLHTNNAIRSLLKELRTCSITPLYHERSLLLCSPVAHCINYTVPISNASPPWDPYTFTNHIQENKLKYFASPNNLMPKNILPIARNSGMVDISICIRSPQIRSYALRWRMNRLLANYKCHCGAKHNRGHIHSCWQLEDHPLASAIIARGSLPEPKPTNHYNLIDHALNLGLLKSFLTLLHYVTNSDDFIFDPP